MNINRTNYEEFFLLAIDKELDQISILQLQSFLVDNPDLLPEWESLNLSTLSEDTIYTFNQKSILLNIPHKEQFQENLLLFIDNELAPEQTKQILERIASDNNTRNEYNLLQKTRLSDEIEVEYPWKKELYRKETRKRYSVFRIAAAVIFIVACTFFYIANNKAGNSSQFLSVNPEPSKKTAGLVQILEKNKPSSISHGQNDTKISSIQPSIVSTTETSKIVVVALNEKDSTDQLNLHPLSTRSIQKIASNSATVIATADAGSPLINELDRALSNTLATTNTIAQSTKNTFEEDENTPTQIFITDTNKSSKARGLLRKLVRYTSKAAELVTASSENENVIQIASFEITRK